MMHRSFAILRITFKRLTAQPGLTLATLLGLTIAVSLIATVPLYADAVSFRVLEQQLTERADESSLPAFAYVYRYIGTWHGSLQWEDTRALDDYLTRQGSADLGLPLQLLVRHFETDNFRLYPADSASYSNPEASLTTIKFAATSGIAGHIDVIEGQFPATADPTPGGAVEVLVSEVLALELGLQVGDRFTAFDFRNVNAVHRQVPVRIAGVWRPQDAGAPFWFYKPHVFNTHLLITEESFVRRLAPYLDDEVNRAVWYLLLDGSRVGVNDISWITGRAQQVERRVGSLLPNAASGSTPTDALISYQNGVQKLTRLLTAFNVPLIGLILAFIGLAVGLSVNQRRNEIAVLRSRGATAAQIIALALLEGLLLGLAALVLGLLGGLLLTQLMGKTQSFLDFSADTSLRVALTDTAVRAGLWAIGLAVLAQVLPTLGAARDTVITYKQEQARAIKPPWWQRAWLDLLLFIPAAYGIYLLRFGAGWETAGNGPLSGPAENLSNDPFQNPFLFLLPALIVLSFSLFFLRLLPWLMAALSWLLSRTDSVSLLLATRYLSRTPGRYATPLILLVLTVSLSVFTASLAQTVDFQLYDERLYRVGTDMNLIGPGLAQSPVGPFVPSASVPQGIFLPMSEYLELPGVVASARVGRYTSQAQVANERIPSVYLGIDRSDFGQVAFWRYDFAADSLGHLLNKLAADPEGMLVSQAFMRQRGLRVGDFFRLAVRVPGGEVLFNAQIVGAFDYFPTWYPERDGPLFVGNLESLFQQVGGDLPYQVWLRTTPAFEPADFGAALRSRRLFNWYWSEPYAGIQQEQLRPERQGMFGLLTVGFAAAALLTVVGFFLYALFSFRRRFIELGILRAVGLSTRQMMVLVGCELAFLVLAGLGLGAALGTWVSQLFIPTLQAAVAAPIPPYLVEIAWSAILQVTLLFTLILAAALTVLGLLFLRMQIFQAIKLGETV